MLNKQFIGEHKLFLFVGLLTFIVLFTVMNINNRFTATDFEVYYYAAKAFLEGQPIYGVAFGSSSVGFYKYSPFTLLFYLPATFLPFKFAAAINYFFMALAGLFSVMISSYLVVKRIYQTGSPVTNTLLFLTFLLSITFFNREVRMGNTNNLLLLLICIVLLFNEKQKALLNGLLWSVAFSFKPYLLIVLLPVPMHRKFKIFISTLVFGIIWILTPMILLGFAEGSEYYHNWFAALLAHSNYIANPFTIDSLMHRYLGAGPDYNLTIYVIALLILGYISLKLYGMVNRQNTQENASGEQSYLLESFTLLAFIPNLVNTDSQQLLYSIPLVAFLTQYLIEKRKLTVILPYLLLFFFFSVNQPDLLGRAFSEKLYQMGIAGICNLLIIAFSWIIFLKERRLFTGRADYQTLE